MLIEVCANGARAIDEHPVLSADPDALGRECAEAILEGAEAVHIHPKNDAGEESLLARDVDKWVAATRRHCPGTPIGITTGEWALPNVDARTRAIDEWTELPDFASVNWHEPGADDLAAKLLSREIGVEAGLWHVDGFDAWKASPVRRKCLRVLIEIQDMGPGQAREEARILLERVRTVDPEMPILLHGEGGSTWVLLEMAALLGLDSRVGLEDSLTLPDGTQASGNAELIRIAHRVAAKAKEGD